MRSAVRWRSADANEVIRAFAPTTSNSALHTVND
jgi:hypothetical protein